jgi:hypothetical protein
MIGVTGGWAQWDQMIGTFRADVNGTVIGNYTGEISTLAELEGLLNGMGITLNEQDRIDLQYEKDLAEQDGRG